MSLPRRAFLTRTGALAAGAGLASTGLVSLAGTASASGRDYTARETFDYFDETFHDGERVGQPDHSNEAGALAWGQSYVLAAFIKMYYAYGDTYYLDRLIHNVDIMLTTRDSERGVTDYRGLSLPAWRADNHYTVGIAALADDTGRPTLEFRSARAYANTASVTVNHNADGTFTLVAHNEQYGYTDTYADLSMDPASPNYAVRRIYDAYPSSRMLVTARDLEAGTEPAAGTRALVPQHVIFAVHTGMITYPIASFVRLVRKTPKLRDNPHYAAKAATYLEAIEDAVAVHDREWRENDAGEGYYQWVKGMPLPYDGNAQPVNQSTALGRTLVELARATADEGYVDRATKMARMFRNQLMQHGDRTAIWHYWPTFAAIWEGYDQTGSPETDVSVYTPRYRSGSGGAQQIEDCSHGAISVDFAWLAYENGLVFRYPDLARLARTFTQNLATFDDGVATVFTRIDGTSLAPAGQYLQAPRWMAAARWDPRVFTHSRAIYDARAPEPGFGSGLLAVASLNWGAVIAG